MFSGPDIVIDSLNRFQHASAAGIVILAHVVFPVGLAAVALSRAAFASSRARRAKEDALRNTPLVPGPAVVRGKVKRAKGEELALCVEIDQHGVERETKSTWTFTWTESQRRTKFRPFYVHDVRGARVRIEPDENTRLIDKLDRTVKGKGPTRTLVAELSDDESVFVVGELTGEASAGSYRSAPSELVMKPPRRGPMICSADPLDQRFVRENDQQRSAGIAFLVLAAALFVLDVGFYIRLVAGEHASATLQSSKRITGKSSRCAVTLVTDGGSEFSDDVPTSWCSSLRPGAKLAILDPGMGGWFAQVGTRPGLHSAALVVGTFFVVFGAILYARRTKPWYEAPLVEHGVGRLPK